MDRPTVHRSKTTGGMGKPGVTSNSRPIASSAKPLPGKPLPTVPPATVHRSNTTANLGVGLSGAHARAQVTRQPIAQTQPTNYSRPQQATTPSRPVAATVKRSNTTPLARTTPPTTTTAPKPTTTAIRLPPTAQPKAAPTQKGPPPPSKSGALARSKSESQKPGGIQPLNKTEAIKALKAPLPPIPQGVVAKNLVLVAEPNATVLDSGLPNVTSNHIVRVVESGGLCLKEAERALYGRHAPPGDRITWNRTAENDTGVKVLLEWIERTRWGLASLGLHKFMATRSRGALVFNVHGRLQSSPDTPAVDWITFEDAQRTLDPQLQNYIGTYDPAKHVLIFTLRVSPSQGSLKIWGKKIGIPASLPVTYATEIKEIKKKLSKKSYAILTMDSPDKPSRSLSLTRWLTRKKTA